MSVHFGVSNPTRLTWEQVTNADGVRAYVMTAHARGDRLTVLASPERWNRAVMDLVRGRVVDQTQVVREMYERGECDVLTLELQLGRSLGLER